MGKAERVFLHKFFLISVVVVIALGHQCRRDFSLVAVNGGYSPGVVGSLLSEVASLVASMGFRALGFSSDNRQAQWSRVPGSRAEAQELWHTGSGIEPTSPALADEFSTTEPPETPATCFQCAELAFQYLWNIGIPLCFY